MENIYLDWLTEHVPPVQGRSAISAIARLSLLVLAHLLFAHTWYKICIKDGLICIHITLNSISPLKHKFKALSLHHANKIFQIFLLLFVQRAWCRAGDASIWPKSCHCYNTRELAPQHLAHLLLGLPLVSLEHQPPQSVCGIVKDNKSK